jgi:hypothetical protein
MFFNYNYVHYNYVHFLFIVKHYINIYWKIYEIIFFLFFEVSFCQQLESESNVRMCEWVNVSRCHIPSQVKNYEKLAYYMHTLFVLYIFSNF